MNPENRLFALLAEMPELLTHADWLSAIFGKIESGEYEMFYPSVGLHFTHRSTEKPELLAYFPIVGAEKARQMKPGKYLQAFCPFLDDAERQEIVERWNASAPNALEYVELKTTEEWIHAYGHHIGTGSLDGSCMRHTLTDRDIAAAVSMYSTCPDCALAVLRESTGEKRTVARAVLNVADKLYGREYYGHWQGIPENEIKQKFIDRLNEAGYSSSLFPLEGLQFRAEWRKRGKVILMPYIDGAGHGFNVIEEDTDHCLVEIARRADYSADTTDGLVSLGGKYKCASCGERLDEDEGFSDDYDLLCETCWHERYPYSCEQCGDSLSEEDAIIVRGHATGRNRTYDTTYCDHCARRKGIMKCDDCGEWHDGDEMVYISDDSEDFAGDSLCFSCIESRGAVACEGCNEYFIGNIRSKENGEGVCANCAEENDLVACPSCEYAWVEKPEDEDDIEPCENCQAKRLRAQGLEQKTLEHYA